eukprot:6032570-Pyramimonas_sp.AAC.1
MLYLYLGEWDPRVWDMSEVYNPMYPTAPATSSNPKRALESEAEKGGGARVVVPRARKGEA